MAVDVALDPLVHSNDYEGEAAEALDAMNRLGVHLFRFLRGCGVATAHVPQMAPHIVAHATFSTWRRPHLPSTLQLLTGGHVFAAEQMHGLGKEANEE